jgi:hypothetical protein
MRQLVPRTKIKFAELALALRIFHRSAEIAKPRPHVAGLQHQSQGDVLTGKSLAVRAWVRFLVLVA